MKRISSHFTRPTQDSQNPPSIGSQEILLTKLRFKNEDLINYDTIHAISNNKIFYALKKETEKSETSLTIVDKNMQKLATTQIPIPSHQHLIESVKSLNATDLFVILHDPTSEKTFLSHYDSKFHKLKSFNSKSRRVHYLSTSEIILQSVKKSDDRTGKLFIVLTPDLKTQTSFGQFADPARPFFFKSSDVQIIGADSERLVVNYLSNRKRLFVYSRQEGNVVNELELLGDLNGEDLGAVCVDSELNCYSLCRQSMKLRVVSAREGGRVVYNEVLSVSNDFDRFNLTGGESAGCELAFYYLDQNEIQYLRIELEK